MLLPCLSMSSNSGTILLRSNKWGWNALTSIPIVTGGLLWDGYRRAMEKHIIEPIGDRYIDEITADDLKMLMVPVSKMSKGLYGTVNMLVKCVFYSAVESDVIRDNPAECINMPKIPENTTFPGIFLLPKRCQGDRYLDTLKGTRPGNEGAATPQPLSPDSFSGSFPVFDLSSADLRHSRPINAAASAAAFRPEKRV